MSNHENSEEIREDIAETRRDMGRKIDQIQSRLSPENLKSQASAAANEFVTATADSVRDYFRDNSAELSRTVMDAVKHNPIPAALVALGLGWIVVESLSTDRETSTQYPLKKYDPNTNYNYSGQYPNSNQYRPSAGNVTYGNASRNNQEQSLPEKVSGAVSNAAQTVQEKAQEWTKEAGERMNDVKNQAQEQFSDWKEQSQRYAQQGQRYVQNVGSDVQEYASEASAAARQSMHEDRNIARQKAEQAGGYAQQMGEQAQSYAQQAGQQVRDTTYAVGNQVQRSLEENPLTFGVVTFAVGAAIGLMLPQTRSENQWLGQMSDELRDTTRAAASDVMQRAQETVEQVRPELERTAQKVTDDLKETAKTIGSDLKQKGQETAQDVQNAADRTKDVVSEQAKAAQEDVKQRAEQERDKIRAENRS